MKFGLHSINIGVCAYPATMTRLATAAEGAGFDSLWVAEHVVLPDPRTPPSPLEPETRLLDPVVALTYLAAQTTRILLATGILILPQRNPLILAKQLASLDALSGGRLIFGIGVGYLEPEFLALGIPFADRGARTEEYLAAIQAIWSQERPAYHGRFASFANVQAHPQPQRQVPIVMGGHTPAVYRRVVERAHGWYGYALDLAGVGRAIADLRGMRQRYPRPAALGELEISITPAGPVDREMAMRFADLGVHRLILTLPYDTNEAAVYDFVMATGEALIGEGNPGSHS
jgi:probable F420-dependent oxidoreductase